MQYDDDSAAAQSASLNADSSEMEQQLMPESYRSGPGPRSTTKSALDASGAVYGAVGGQDSHAAMEEHRRKLREKAEQENATLWQHPFVDVFKHFKVSPGSDWKVNKKQGEVNEYFAREIGRRAIAIEGTISANNYIQTPHPQSATKSLGLTGRYCYLQVKCPRHGLAFSYHLDLGMAERSHGVRISVSNLFKNFGSSNGFVAQVPLELKNNCWTIVVLDLYEILRQSQLLPTTYLIEGSYQIRSITICANTHVRGIFTSDNLYDHVTLPADMRYKFAFDLSKWHEYFHWQMLPQDWGSRRGPNGDLIGDENLNLPNLVDHQKRRTTKEEQRLQMRAEIDDIMNTGKDVVIDEAPQESLEDLRRRKYEEMQRQLNMQFQSGPADAPVTGFTMKDEDDRRPATGLGGMDYKGGMYSGIELERSHKLNKDPIMELQHVIGYQAEKCTQVRWSHAEGESVVIFATGGSLIAMDTETSEQKRFFFGHSAPICCFDVSRQGNMLASAQEGKRKRNDEDGKGKPALIRLWDYATARCITMMIMPVIEMQCMTFSHDGRYLTCVGLDHHNKELLIVWDISRVQRGEKPEIVAKQTSEFNVLEIKFSPNDPTRLASCGRENIRLWRIRDTGNIRGSAVVLNHHARNTVFTCLDFEYGFRSTDKHESESLMRLFVGTKHGMVFIVNYQNETLEAPYKTNDAAIYSIAVNEAFCVIGSMDSYLRVWPLDFQDFFMEAQHEGIVSSVDISNDGLKVACGTMYGSIGILDKSNQGYKTLLRSHTDEILAIDYHKVKNNIITVSTDRTIRLWDLESLEEVYEFSSPIDQPVSIASHPAQSIFACGFQSGKMRIFDIETTEVLDEFSQFSLPLESLAYDNVGRFLIAVCKDGSVSIHNAARQHLPVKMMQLAQPPEFVHVAFTEALPNEHDPARNQRFAVMGENGNNIIAYDTESFIIQHQIQVNTIVKFFKFANGNRDLLVATKDCRIRFYSLQRYEGIFMREVANCHRGELTAMDVSANSGYMLTGGEDTLLKIWDYEAQETRSYNFQSFIGHTYKLQAVMFNPKNNRQIISVGLKDGIFFWDFNGDTDGDYALPGVAGQDLQSLEAAMADPMQISMLQQMRTQGKQAKEFRNQMREDSFYLPMFIRLDPQPRELGVERDFFDPPVMVKERRDDLKLAYNHYVGLSKKVDVAIESGAYMALNLPSIANDPKFLEQKLINGYDGFGGVHDNIIWHPTGGLTFFTLNNKLIIEETQTRKQQIFVESNVQFSCLACSQDFKFVAVGEGHTGANGKSQIYLYNIEKRILVRSLPFHEKGVQSLAFSPDVRYLVSVGVRDDKLLVVWDVHQQIAVFYQTLTDATVNAVRVDPWTSSSSLLQIITVGNNGSMTVWRCDLEQSAMQASQITGYKVVPDPALHNVNFCAFDFTHRLPVHGNAYYILIGCSDGTLVAYDPQEDGLGWIDVDKRGKILDGEIGVVSVKSQSVVIGSSKGTLMYYPIEGACVQPMQECESRCCEAAIISVHMDEFNREGLVGTEAGQIFYINFSDRENEKPVRIISSVNHNQDAVQLVKFDSVNPNIFISACGLRSDAFMIQANENCDELRRFGSNLDEDGYVVFVLSAGQSRSTGKSQRSSANRKTVGFSNGVLKRANLDNLTFTDIFKVDLRSGEKITCGFQAANDSNILMGTNQGTLFIVSIQMPSRARRVEASYCRIDNVGKCNSFDNLPGDEAAKKAKTHQKLNSDIINDDNAQIDDNSLDIVDSQLLDYDFTGITCVSTPSTDPIGTILVGFDDGTVRLWQNQRNEHFTKILKLKAAVKHSNLSSLPDDKLKTSIREQAAKFDIAGFGYQQFDLADLFDVFSNPHGLDTVTDEDRLAAKAYQGKKYPSMYACFPPGENHSQKTFQLMPMTTYICIVDALACIYIRDFAKNDVRRISLNHFPTCIATGEPNKWKSGEDQPYAVKETAKKEPKQNYMIAVGTKEGTVHVLQVGPLNHMKLFETRAGLSYGAISSVDIQPTGEYIVAGTETGETLQYELLKKLNEDNEDE